MQDTIDLIEKYPFVCKFSTLGTENEILRIKRDIDEANRLDDGSPHFVNDLIQEESEEEESFLGDSSQKQSQDFGHGRNVDNVDDDVADNNGAVRKENFNDVSFRNLLQHN